MSQLVRDVMSPGAITVGPEDRLEKVHQLLQEHGFHHVVVTEKDRVIGVISDRDLLKVDRPFIGRTLEHEPAPEGLNLRVRDVIARKPITVTADATVAEAAKILLRENVSCLPVASPSGTLEGVLTVRDILRLVAQG